MFFLTSFTSCFGEAAVLWSCYFSASLFFLHVSATCNFSPWILLLIVTWPWFKLRDMTQNALVYLYSLQLSRPIYNISNNSRHLTAAKNYEALITLLHSQFPPHWKSWLSEHDIPFFLHHSRKVLRKNLCAFFTVT